MEKTIINAKLSNCCSSSVSVNYGISEFGNKLLYITTKGNKDFHYSCNKCGKECKMNEVPYWELILRQTDTGFQPKYRRLEK